MAIKRTYINADEELVIKGKLTIEGNVTQIESTQQVTNLEGNVFTINSDGDNTTAQLKLNSNGNFGTLSFTDGGNIVAEPGLQGNLYVGPGQQVFIEGGGTIGGGGFTGNLTGTASNADALTSAVTIDLTGDVTGSATFINAGDTASITTDISNTAVTPNTYGNATNVGQFTVASDGRLTQADSILIAIPSSQVTDFTTAVRSNVSVTDTGGDGSLTYNSGTGVFTYTGPSLAEVQLRIDNSAANVRAHFSGGDGIDLASGVIDVDSTVVRTSGDQSIAGEKTFTGQVNISANIIPTTSNTFNLGSWDNHFDEIFGNVVHAERLDLGDADLTDIHNTFYAGTPTGNILQSRSAGGLTYEHNGPGSLNPGGYYRVNTGDGLIISGTDVAVGQGDGITVNTNDVAVDSTVIRTTGSQTISGDKTFTGNVDLSGAGTIAGFTVDGDLAVSGNIQATGNLNTVNQIDLIVDDSNITLNNGNVAQDSHIKIDRPGGTGSDTYLKWNETDDRWQFSNDGSTDNDMLLLTDFSVSDTGGDGSLTYSSVTGVFTYTGPSASEVRAHFSATNGVDYNSSTGAFQAVESEIQHDSLDGFVANEHIDHTSVSIIAGTGLTGGGNIASSTTLNVVGGDGITANANDIEVDSTVVRTTGDQSLAGQKTFTGNLLLPTTDVAVENAIFTDSNEAWVYVNGSKKQITPTASIGSAEEANSSLSYVNLGTTGTSTYELYAGQRTVGSDTFHAIKGLESGTYTTISSAATALTIDADISAIRGAFSVTDTGGDGSLTYNSGSGVFTYTGPSASEVRAHFSASGTELSYNSGTGAFTSTADNYGSWDFDTDTGSAQSVSSGGTVNILGGTGIDVTHSGSTITVTNTNDADITGVTAGSGLTGGGSSGTVTLNIGAGDGITVNGDNVTVDSSVVRTSGNQSIGGDKTLTGSTQINSLNVNGAYSFPTADGTINQVLTTNGSGTLAFQPVSAIGLTSVTGGDGLTATVGVGKTELDVVGGFGITVNADDIELNNTSVRSLFSASDSGGDGSFSYNSGTGAFTYTGPSASETRAHFSVTDTGGDGSLAYNSGTGVFTYTGPSASEVRAHFSGSNGVNYNSTTGAITADSAEIRALFSAGGDLSYNSTTGEFSFTNDAGDIESVEVLAGVGLSGGGSATSGTFSTTLTLDLDELTTSTTNSDGDYFAVVDTAGNQKKLTKGSINVSGFNNDIGYSTTTGTVTQVDGGSGLTGSVTTSGSLAVGAGNYILVGANDVGVDATSTNTANKVVARDGSGNFAAGTITATATQAQYADLAENYEADSDYEPGTVLILGGDKEVTVTDEPGSFKAMGVVSTDPAHLMNVDCEGEHVVAVALRGRIPCKVAGTCKKGDVLITSDTPGHAMVAGDPKSLSPLQIIGRALEHKTSAAPGVVEIIV